MPHPQDNEFSEAGFEEEVIDFKALFTDEDEVTAPEYPDEGIYHVQVQSVDSSGKSLPGAVFLTFEILAGNVEKQEGKTIRYPIWPVSERAKNKEMAKRNWMKTVLQLMLALKLRKKGEFLMVKFNDAWWQSLEGRQCIAKVTHQEQKRTTDAGKEITWTSAVIAKRSDFFPIGDEAISEVNIDEQAAILGGYITPDDEAI